MNNLITEENIITESIVPMNFNFKQAKIQQQYPMNGQLDDYSGYNPMVNMNDPMIKHELEKKRKAQAEMIKLQKRETDKTYCARALQKCMESIDNLIKGNAHKGFTYDDSLLLLNSIRNKCNEILNSNLYNIDNDILEEMVNQYQMLYANQYSQDCVRYKLEWSSNTISFNTNEGIVRFNPHGLYDIAMDWINKHQTHGKNTDEMIYG